MFYIWPTFQDGIFKFGQWIASSGYGGTFVYGIVKRALFLLAYIMFSICLFIKLLLVVLWKSMGF